MEPTLQGALLKVFGVDQPTGGSTGTTGTALPTNQSGDAKLAQQLYTDATKAQRAGDWSTYGAKIKQLGEVLQRMAAKSAAGTGTAGGK
jgi:uncharacterized membrane protein (UPF0182 family)